MPAISACARKTLRWITVFSRSPSRARNWRRPFEKLSNTNAKRLLFLPDIPRHRLFSCRGMSGKTPTPFMATRLTIALALVLSIGVATAFAEPRFDITARMIGYDLVQAAGVSSNDKE